MTHSAFEGAPFSPHRLPFAHLLGYVVDPLRDTHVKRQSLFTYGAPASRLLAYHVKGKGAL